MKSVFARSVIIDHEEHTAHIDGVRIPWHMPAPGPTVEKFGDSPVLELTMGILIDGCVTIRTGEGDRTFDPVLGDVGAYARRYVRDALHAEFPWLAE